MSCDEELEVYVGNKAFSREPSFYLIVSYESSALLNTVKTYKVNSFPHLCLGEV